VAVATPTGALSPGVTPTPCPSPFEISPPMSAFDAFDDSDAFDSAWRGVRRTVSECVQDGLPGNAPTWVATPLSTVSSVPMSTSMVGGRHERAANRTVNRNVDSVGVDPKLLQCITSPHLPAPIALGSVEKILYCHSYMALFGSVRRIDRYCCYLPRGQPPMWGCGGGHHLDIHKNSDTGRRFHMPRLWQRSKE